MNLFDLPEIELAVASNLKVGQKVRARWSDGKYYLGKISKLEKGKATVAWADGAKATQVDRSHIKSLAKAKAATKVAKQAAAKVPAAVKLKPDDPLPATGREFAAEHIEAIAQFQNYGGSGVNKEEVKILFDPKNWPPEVTRYEKPVYRTLGLDLKSVQKLLAGKSAKAPLASSWTKDPKEAEAFADHYWFGEHNGDDKVTVMFKTRTVGPVLDIERLHRSPDFTASIEKHEDAGEFFSEGLTYADTQKEVILPPNYALTAQDLHQVRIGGKWLKIDRLKDPKIMKKLTDSVITAAAKGKRARTADEEDPEVERPHFETLNKTGFYGAQGAGCIVLALDTGRILLAHRSREVQEPGTWGGWGGAIDPKENPQAAAEREVYEEAGYEGKILRTRPLYVFRKGSFTYYNFLVVVPREFTPDLNWESQGYRWCAYEAWPKPLHPGLRSLFMDDASMKTIEQNLPKDKTTVTAADEKITVPEGVRKAARRGLELRKAMGGRSGGGTGVGVARARDLAGGRTSRQSIKRMHSYFSRHAADKNAEGWGSTSNPSKGYVAWLLWGGDAGASFAAKKVKQFNSEKAVMTDLEEAAPKKKVTKKPAKKPPTAKGKPKAAPKAPAALGDRYRFDGKKSVTFTKGSSTHKLAPGGKFSIAPASKGRFKLHIDAEGGTKIFFLDASPAEKLLARCKRLPKPKMSGPAKTSVTKKATKTAKKPASKTVKVEKKPVNPDPKPAEEKTAQGTALSVGPQKQFGGSWNRAVYWGDDRVGTLLYKKTTKEIWFKPAPNTVPGSGGPSKEKFESVDAPVLVGPYKTVNEFVKKFAKLAPVGKNLGEPVPQSSVMQIKGDSAGGVSLPGPAAQTKKVDVQAVKTAAQKAARKGKEALDKLYSYVVGTFEADPASAKKGVYKALTMPVADDVSMLKLTEFFKKNGFAPGGAQKGTLMANHDEPYGAGEDQKVTARVEAIYGKKEVIINFYLPVMPTDFEMAQLVETGSFRPFA